MEPMKHLNLHLLLVFFFLSVYSVYCAAAEAQSPPKILSPLEKPDAVKVAAPKILSPLEKPHDANLAAKVGQLPFAVDDNIRKICSKTDYPEVCLTGIGPFLDGKDDPNSVIQMLVKSTRTLALTTQAKVKKISEDPSTDSFTARMLDACWGSYNDSVSSLDDAMKALQSNDVAGMNSYLSSAFSNFGICDDAFTEGGHGSPVYDMDKQLEDLVSNCLAISSQFMVKN
ncbi:hypothetical protein Sjap_007279 [Stephania japonica]|uniref:Pectinesterase inhibitor domain-containing protein n=1 Tax=Stephania japonica TaxID=461633 RepID=A0AAP0JN54_9MAGN